MFSSRSTTKPASSLLPQRLQDEERPPDAAAQVRAPEPAHRPAPPHPQLHLRGQGQQARVPRPLAVPHRQARHAGQGRLPLKVSFIPEIEVFYMLFDSSLSIFSMISLKLHIESVYFRC